MVPKIVLLMSRTCDVVALRKVPKKRREVCWWSVEMAEIREKCVKARCDWIRSKGRSSCPIEEKESRQCYSIARCQLCNMIKRAKTQAWRELIATVDEDLWST